MWQRLLERLGLRLEHPDALLELRRAARARAVEANVSISRAKYAHLLALLGPLLLGLANVLPTPVVPLVQGAIFAPAAHARHL